MLPKSDPVNIVRPSEDLGTSKSKRVRGRKRFDVKAVLGT